MSGCANAVRAGRNEFLRLMQLRMDDCEYVGAQFNDQMFYTEEFVSIFEVPMWTGPEYTPNGGTELPRAFKNVVAAVDKRIALAKRKSEPAPTNVTFVIQSDGASCTTGMNTVEFKALVDAKRREGWHFVYLAEGQRAYDAATAQPAAANGFFVSTNRMNGLGFPPSEVIMYNGTKTAAVFEEIAYEVLESLVTGAPLDTSHRKAISDK